MSENDQEKFEQQIKQRLDQHVEGMDGETLSRLRQARTKALEAKKPTFHWQPFGGAVALASVVALTVSIWLVQPTGDLEATALDDIEMLASSEEPEFYEDVEFYYWLETQQDVRG